ncbi:hypothetical protein ES703_66932 [subsurface metagenome]
MTVYINGVLARIGKSGLWWALNKLLKGAGAGVDPTEIDMPAGVTKEFFVPATGTLNGAADANYDNHATVYLGAVDQSAYIEFFVPHDFSSITEAVVVIIPKMSRAAADYDIFSNYAASGQPYTAHSESDLVTTYNTTANQIFEVSIAGILSSLAVGDYVGIRFFVAVANDDNCNVLGVRFKYS